MASQVLHADVLRAFIGSGATASYALFAWSAKYRVNATAPSIDWTRASGGIDPSAVEVTDDVLGEACVLEVAVDEDAGGASPVVEEDTGGEVVQAPRSDTVPRARAAA